MEQIEHLDFTTPDETRSPEKTTVELVNIAGGQIGRYTFQPGWRWSECIKPVVNTETCQVDHLGYVISGSLHVQHSDGTQVEVRAGEVYRIPPGHDAWNDGAEPAVFVEFQGAASYARSGV
ncbi:MAG TPA: cupin domain-containing protein [Tepidiformaceae bacterium]|nr:cupin domain-containing protein [Tepidiformaceae bacterium]